MFRKLFGKNSSPSEQALEFTKQGVSAFQMGNVDAAINYYDKALEINHQLEIAYINRGYAYFSRGNLSQAIEDATKAIEINPESIDAHGVRGDSHFQDGNYDQAIMDYSRAIELNPQLGGAYTKRAYTYHAKGQLSRAVADFESYLSFTSNKSARTDVQNYINYLNDHGAKDGDVDFSPRIPEVDSDMLTEEVLILLKK